jgi:von Willebrand factor type D domain
MNSIKAVESIARSANSTNLFFGNHLVTDSSSNRIHSVPLEDALPSLGYMSDFVSSRLLLVATCITDMCCGGSACTAFQLYETACHSRGIHLTGSAVYECGVCFGDDGHCNEARALGAVWGDPHYQTLDGAIVSFDGICDFTMAKDTNSPSLFDVQISQNNVSGHVRLTGVGVRLPGNTIELYPGGALAVNGRSITTLPYSFSDGSVISNTANGGVKIFLSASRVVINTARNYRDSTNTILGVMTLSIPKIFFGKTTGIAATNFNGILNDDLGASSVNISVIDMWRFCNSFRVAANHILSLAPTNCPTIITPPPTCSNAAAQLMAEAHCSMLRDFSSPLAKCFPFVLPQGYFASCIVDFCIDGSGEETVEVYRLAAKAVNCIFVDIFDVCGVLNGDGSSCAASFGTCTAFQSHIVSFDGLQMDFLGKCTYTLVKDCEVDDFQIQIRRNYVNFTNFYSNQAISNPINAVGDGNFVVDIKGRGPIIELSGSTVRIDGISAASLPVVLSDGTVVSKTYYSVTVRLPNQVVVVLTSTGVVTVSLPRILWSSRTCGLCGPFSGIPSNNLLLPTGAILASQTRGRFYQFQLVEMEESRLQVPAKTNLPLFSPAPLGIVAP